MTDPVTIEILVPKHGDVKHDDIVVVVGQQCCKSEESESDSESENCDDDDDEQCETKVEICEDECYESYEKESVCEESESESECAQENSEPDSEKEEGTCVKFVIPSLSYIVPVSRFYGLTSGRKNTLDENDRKDTDYAQPILPGFAVPFPKIDFESSGIIYAAPSKDTFLLGSVGLYRVEWNVHTNESGQLQLAVQSPSDLTFVPVVSSSGGNSGFVRTTVANTKLQLVNPIENAKTLIIQNENPNELQWANAQSIIITRLR